MSIDQIPPESCLDFELLIGLWDVLRKTIADELDNPSMIERSHAPMVFGEWIAMMTGDLWN